jgi:hypothetical protein
MSATLRSRLGVPALIVLCGIFGVQEASAEPQALRGMAIDETLDAPPVLSEAMAKGIAASSLPLLVRLAIEESSFRGAAATSAFARLDARFDLYRTRDVTVILALGAFPESDPDVDEWLETVRSIAGHLKGQVRAYQVGDVTRASLPDADRYAYVLKRAATEIKSVDPEALVLQGPIPVSAADFLARTYRAGAAPYSDGVAIDAPVLQPTSQNDAQGRRAVEDMAQVVEREDPTASVVVGSVRLPAEIGSATSRLIESQLRTVGTKVGVVAYAAGAETLRAALTAAARIADVLGGDVVTLDESPRVATRGESVLTLQFLSGGADISTRVPHRLLYSPGASSTYLVYWADAASPSVDLEITTDAMTTPAVRDPLTGETQPITVRRLEGARLRLTLPAAGHALILDFSAGEKTYTSRADVRVEALPRVEEIIARAQQAQAAEDAALTRYVAHVRVETHFRPVPADPAYNVVTENRLFVDHSGVEWEELSFSMNGATWTANRPGFPLLQPEKVLSLPLDLRLNQDYAYQLAGVEMIGGREAFVVEFTPTSASRALYRGTVWIDRQAFVRLKVHAVETHLAGTVVSNDETEMFAPAGVIAGAAGLDRPVWLLDHATTRQVLLIAGRSVPLEREVRFSEFQLNASTFDEERATARASDRVMYRDTDQGLRYFVKQGGARVVSDTLTTSARALVMGADVDPSFARPLPIAGFDLLDFNFMHRNLQLALLFGGVIGTGNIQRAGLLGGKVNASLDFFGIALKAQDVVFDGAGERTGERVLSIPASVGFNVGWQFAAFQKVTARYELRYDAYFRDPKTATDFVLPSNTATNGLEAGYEYRRRGYSVTGSAGSYRRSTWTPWGAGADFDPSTRTYVRYQAQASKDFVFRTFHTIHLNTAYFGGDRLDRFSMYRFGLFDDTKIHGVPSAVRLSELAMARGSYAFNLFDQYRIEVSLDRATGRDMTSGGWQTLTGVGVGVNLRGPRNTILRADVGKSFLPAVYRGSGSYRIQFMLLKPLK